MRSIIIALSLSTPLVAESSAYYLKLALENNARLKAEAQLQSAAESDFRRESIFLESPELMLGFMNVPVNTFPALNRDNMSSFSVGISQRIALPWEAHYRKIVAEQRAVNSGFNFALFKASLHYEIMEKLNAIRFFTERGKNLSVAKKLIHATLRVLAVPRKEARNTAASLLEARAALATIENELATNDYELEKSWLELEALCGQKLNRLDASTLLPDWDNFSLAQENSTEQLKQSLIYKKAESEVRAQQAIVSLSRSSLFPEVKVSTAYMFRQGVPGSSMAEDMISVSASTPLPAFYTLKNRHDIESQNKRLAAAENMLAETERQLAAQVASETAKLKALLVSIENYAKTILPAHNSAHRSHLANINLMGGSAAEALSAYRMYLNAGEERLRQIREANSARFRLEYLLTADNKEDKK